VIYSHNNRNRKQGQTAGDTTAVLRPDEVQAILQLLKQDGNARITSAPRVQANDNAVGFINSIPTTQTNQGETATTISSAGFVEAGTQFAITPHISENDYLRIEHQITHNSFGKKPTDPSIPPPGNTTSIQSQATVPNGSTIVVGGLQTEDEIENIDKVPILGDIPLLGWAVRNTIIEKQHKTTYLFITRHIMEDENFSDINQVSDNALKEIEANETEHKQEGAADVNVLQ
jgi:type IV pilus assembly protein PilQ